MKKVLKLEDLGCAHCASKMEEAICKLDGVKSANINFIMQKLTIEADDEVFDDVVKKSMKICKKIEPDCRIIF